MSSDQSSESQVSYYRLHVDWEPWTSPSAHRRCWLLFAATAAVMVARCPHTGLIIPQVVTAQRLITTTRDFLLLINSIQTFLALSLHFWFLPAVLFLALPPRTSHFSLPSVAFSSYFFFLLLLPTSFSSPPHEFRFFPGCRLILREGFKYFWLKWVRARGSWLGEYECSPSPSCLK